MAKDLVEDKILTRDEYILKINKKGEKTTIRDLQLEILPIIDEIHRICTKNNIEYALHAGSALGIVNYKGFIPWDDDVDIIVKYEDWNRLVEALKKELKEPFYFHSYEVDKKFNTINGPWMKIRKRGTYIKEVHPLLPNRCKGDGAFVDLIPYGPVSPSRFKHECYMTLVRIVMPFIIILDNLRINPRPLKSFVIWLSYRYYKKNEGSHMVSQPISFIWEKVPKVFPKDEIFPFKLYDFEGRKFYSYNELELVLVKNYGPNCLKKWDGKKWYDPYPLHKRVSKHFKDINLKSDKREK